ncbi:hypothetical protein TFLX_02279 [Thermoflexales bacterium]|nr:hypothetical protein TFLX_02279 [Thermoflexales bacterium]
MSWLNVPHLRQVNPSWCLPACIAMVATYWQRPLTQDAVANWLSTSWIGTPSSRIQRLTERGFDVVYRTGSVSELEGWLAQRTPCILFVRTSDLPYWKIDTPHAVILAGVEAESAQIIDPDFDTAPVTVSVDELLLA